ncbi:N-acetylmuramoyl-L-alanine amidase [Alkalihalobacillus sp. NPDC078783]
MTKHLLIAGHGTRKNGTFDPGATGFISKGEHRYMKEDLFPAMKKYLPKGHNVVFHDAYNVVDRGNIVALAAQHNASQVTEFHYDAASAAASKGHVIIQVDQNPNNMDLRLRDAIDKMVGVRYNHRSHVGISGRGNLGNANRSVKASYQYRLLELGFGTNKTDADIMVNKVDEYAQALVEAICGSVSVTNDTQTGGTQVEAPKPSPAPAPKPQPTTSNQAAKSGEGIVDYLNRVGIDSSMNNRKKLADQHGIKNYTGTAQQNTDLLNKISSGTTPASKPAPKKTTSSTSAKSGEGLVDYLNRVKINSSFGNREKLAAEHGIKGYKGTAAQNTELLNKISGSAPKAASKPAVKKSSNPKAKNGEGLVDYLKRIKVDSSFGNRQKLASQHGIKGYKGTAKQNSDLLNKISG